MRSRRYLVSVLGTVAVVAAGAGAAAAATGSKTTTSKSASPKVHRTRRYAPNMGGNCPNMGSGHSSGAVGPAGQPNSSI